MRVCMIYTLFHYNFGSVLQWSLPCKSRGNSKSLLNGIFWLTNVQNHSNFHGLATSPLQRYHHHSPMPYHDKCNQSDDLQEQLAELWALKWEAWWVAASWLIGGIDNLYWQSNKWWVVSSFAMIICLFFGPCTGLCKLNHSCPLTGVLGSLIRGRGCNTRPRGSLAWYETMLFPQIFGWPGVRKGSRNKRTETFRRSFRKPLKTPIFLFAIANYYFHGAYEAYVQRMGLDPSILGRGLDSFGLVFIPCGL